MRINAASGGGGGGSGLQSVGDGEQIYKGLNGGFEQIRSIKGLDGIDVALNGDVVEVSNLRSGYLAV